MAVSTFTVIFCKSEIIGVSFVRTTVTLQFVDTDPPFRSLSVTVIVAEPVWPLTARKTITRLEPLPPNRILVFWIKPWLDDAAVSVSVPAGVSTSRTVIGIGALGLSS